MTNDIANTEDAGIAGDVAAPLHRIVMRFREIFQCDTARISAPLDKMFLIIGHRRYTKDNSHQWYRNGEPYDFEYVKETCIASGDTEDELVASANEYKRLSGMTMEEYLSELTA